MEAKDKYEKANEKYTALTTREVVNLTEKEIEEYVTAGISIGRIKNDMKLCRDTLKDMGILEIKKEE